MQILKFLDLFFGAFINVLLYCYIINKTFINKKNSFYKNKNKYLLIVSIIIYIINIFNKYTFKVIVTFPFIVYLIKKYFSVNYKKSILYVSFSLIYIFIAELLISFIMYILPINYNLIIYKILGTSFGNIIVFLIVFLLIKNNKIKEILNKILNNFYKKNNLLKISILIFSLNAITYKGLFNTKTILDFIMNFIVFFAFLILFYILYIEITKFDALSNQYNELLNFLEKYEKELIEKRKIIHDYNNQLIIIKGYIENPIKLNQYLEEIIKEQKQLKNNKLIKNIDKLPLGIKGLIYYKISNLNEKIKIELNVLNNIKLFEKFSSKRSKDILKVLGIIIDNCIESCEKETNKYINISFLCKNNKFIMVTKNYCSQNLDLNKIKQEGYSSKGEKRGYGLTLINEIINKDKNINYKIKLENNEIINELIIKLKKV